MIKATSDKIVVEFLKTTQSAGGIVLPEGAQQPQAFGKVLSIGEEVENVKVGDILVFHMMAGMDIALGDNVWRCLKYDELYGILEDEEFVKRLEPVSLKGNKEASAVPGKGGGIVVP